MAEIGTAYVKIEPSAKGISGSISGALDKEADSAGKSAGSKISSAVGGALKLTAGAAAAGATAVAGVVKSAVSAYSEFEQLEGGAKLLFGSAFDTVMANADSAFSRVQMSANDYLSQANSYATGLKQALGGDEQAAANLADRIMTAQADVVAATGASQESIQNAFSGIMKNNFTMLDNLQIGIKPTKEGMQEVIDKMNELNGTKYEMGNLADMQAAIVDYVDYVGMAGYAHDEATRTIEGSLATTKAAWENLLTSLGKGDTNEISTAIDNLVTSATQLGKNIMPIIEQALSGVSQLITELAPKIAEAIPSLITQTLPGLLSAGLEIIKALGEGILAAIPELLPAITDTILQTADMLISMLPQIVEVGIMVISQLAIGIGQALPELIPTIVDCVLSIVDVLIGNADLLIDGAIALILGLADGLISALPQLLERLPEIIESINSVLVANAPKLILAAVELILALANGLIQALPDLILQIPIVLKAMVDGFLDGIAEFTSVGKDMVEGLWEGIKEQWSQLIDNVMSLGSKLVEKVKGLFKIGSPSKLFADEIGRWIPEGLAVGIEANTDAVTDAVDDMVNATIGDPQLDILTDPTNSMNTSVASGVVANNGNDVVGMLAEYLPLLLSAIENSGVTLEGDAQQMFRMVRKQNSEYMRANGGISAFA